MASTHEAVTSVVQEGVKAAPPVTVVATSFMGVPLQDWVYAATLVYTGVQTYVIIRDKIVKGGKDGS